MRQSTKKPEPEALLDFEDDLAMGEWLHRRLVETFGIETEMWAVEQIRRVERQLQVKRAPANRLTPEILWLSEANAFTTPGRYIYVSRELLQRAASDDPVALVLAHEMAHHDLGHLDPFHGKAALLRRLPAGTDVGLLLKAAERLLFSAEAETAADERALDLCLKAGYDGTKCLQLFDILQSYALDHRDLDLVFGSDASLSDGARGAQRWVTQAKTWGWKRLRGYPSIAERREHLRRRLRGE